MNFSKLLIIGFSFCLLQVANAKIFLCKNTLQDTHYEKTKISTISNKIHDFNIHNYVSNFIMHSLFPDKSKVTINDFRTFINNTSSNDLKNLLTNNKLYGNKDGEINGNEVLKIIKDMKADDIKRLIKKLIPDDNSNDIVNIDGLIQIIDCNESDNVKNILCKVISNNDVKNFVKILPSDTLKEILISLLKDNSNPQATIESIMKKKDKNKKPIENFIENASDLLNTEECKKFESNISSFISELRNLEIIDDNKYKEVNDTIKSEKESLVKKINVKQEDLKNNYDLQSAINLLSNIKALKLAMPDTNISGIIEEKNQDLLKTKVIGESINFYMLERIILGSPIDNIEDIFVKKFKTNSSKKDFSLYAYALELIFNHSLIDTTNTYGTISFIKPDKSEEDLNKLFKKNNMFRIYGYNKLISNYHLWSEDNKYKLDNDKLDSTIENSYKLLNIRNAEYKLRVPTIFTNNELKYVIPHKISEFETYSVIGGQSEFGKQIEQNNQYKLVEQKDVDNIENISDLLVVLSKCLHNYNKNKLKTETNINKVKEFLNLLQINDKLKKDENCINTILCHEIIYNDDLINKIKNKEIDISKAKEIKNIGDLFVYMSKLLENNTNFYKILEQRESED